MVVRVRVWRSTYRDSVALMRLSAAATGAEGVRSATVLMATPMNRELLEEAGLLQGDLEGAAPEDLIAAVEAESAERADACLARIEEMLEGSGRGPAPSFAPGTVPPAGQPPHVRSFAHGVEVLPGANLALISVPGEHAAAQAWWALQRGLNAMIFSDNVPLEQEVELKRYAAGQGLLVMGPDCGTAIIGGVPLAFANRVRRGSIGVVGASGTGMQMVTSLIHQLGGGISHAIGVGGRDLSAAVGGISMLQALDLLAEDPDTRVVVLISKPPDPAVADRVLARARSLRQPVVACFLGGHGPAPVGLIGAATLEEAALRALKAAGVATAMPPAAAVPPAAGRGTRAPKTDARQLRGLFAGGTLAAEAAQLLAPYIGEIATTLPAVGHAIVDFGDDRYTRGRPHPMIDMRLRSEQIRDALRDPTVAVLLFDVILGHGAHPDPAGALASAVASASPRPHTAIVALLVGTDQDPQGLARQSAALQSAGASVCTRMSEAVQFCLGALRGGGAV